MKSFKMSGLNTDAEGSPPPPPAPADPSVEAANAAVAAAAAAAAAAESSQYSDIYPTYNTYLMTRYTDQRYHTPSYTPTYNTHISAHTSTDSGYYRYPDYSRYPYSGGNPSGPTSPRWRRRSYDPDYLSTRRTASVASSGTSGIGVSTVGSRPLSDLAASLVNSPASAGSTSATSSVLMRSRSRSRVPPSEYDPNAYLRYMSPSATATAAAGASTYTTRPMSGYIYGHSYIPTTTSIHTTMDPAGQRYGSAPPPSGVNPASGSNPNSGSVVPQPPPNYNAMDREVSARIRRYQADPSS